MATAKKTESSKEIVTIKRVPVFTLTLSEDETLALYAVTQLVGGDCFFSSRKFISNILVALRSECPGIDKVAEKRFGFNYKTYTTGNIYFKDSISE